MDEKTQKLAVLAVLLLLFTGGVYSYGGFSSTSGMLLILSILLFGGLSLVWKESRVKLACLGIMVFLALFNIVLNLDGMKSGIDFSGGTRIPVVLEKPVDSGTMDSLLLTVKKRANVLGLSNPRVKAVGDNQIIVEMPKSDPAQITKVEEVLSKQGVYTGIVDGKVAVSGDEIYSQSIEQVRNGNALQQMGADWAVQFSLGKQGAQRFADVAKGKAGYPVYMFLDRPTDAIIVLSNKELRGNAALDRVPAELRTAASNALKLESNDIDLYLFEELQANSSLLASAKTNTSTAIVSASVDENIKSLLEQQGYAIKIVNSSEIIPEYQEYAAGSLIVERWEAAGLLSSPALSPQITTGVLNYNYVITGRVPGAVTDANRAKIAQDNAQKIESILKGGSLPVKISLGSRTTIPPTLGSEFLKLSFIGLIAVVVAISLLIGIRYRHIKIVVPIIMISIAELIILVSILGSFEIDLAAIAGIIAALGVGVDSQIVITDELLKKTGTSKEERMGYAFGIIKTNVTVAIVSMIPLLFGVYFGIIEVVGFAISTMLGALLGLLLTRPGYAVLVEKVLSSEIEN